MIEDKLPTPPVLTDEQLALNDVEQRARAKKFRETISAGNVKFARATAIIKETEAIFGDYVSIPKKKSLLTPIQLGHYVTALAQIGDFATAHQFDKTQKFDKIGDAVWGKNECKCPPSKQMQQDGRVTSTSRQFIERQIWSVKDKREVNLLKCAGCGTYTV